MEFTRQEILHARKVGWYIESFYLVCIWALLLGIWYIWPELHWSLKIFTFWMAAMTAGNRVESVGHWTAHFPYHKTKLGNKLNRLAYCVASMPIVLYFAQHKIHHKYDNHCKMDPTTTYNDDCETHTPFWKFLFSYVSWRELVAFPMRREERHECYIHFALHLLLIGILLLLDWKTTLMYWIPAVTIAPAYIQGIYSYTDHLGATQNEWQFATYNPLSRWTRFLSWLDLWNVGSHVTHHRYPATHWLLLPKIHEEEEHLYKKYGTPIGEACNSTFLFNPIAFIRMMYRLSRMGSS